MVDHAPAAQHLLEADDDLLPHVLRLGAAGLLGHPPDVEARLVHSLDQLLARLVGEDTRAVRRGVFGLGRGERACGGRRLRYQLR
ncbi:hypothetical protein [Streptomyces sp. NPDC095817]|uniref:hypothetical protein n=1 Tax=Streptomyces sp. NPDC095817 TaxID=3155082 RepID=UPI003330D613